MAPKQIDGMTVAQRATLQAAAGYNVFKKYSGPGGLREEYIKAALRNPLITKLVSIGKTTNGQDIIALKVTLGALIERDGSKPSTLFMSAQHAREWITPEMNRRLLHYVLDNYPRNRRVRDLVNSTELWFVPVSNPDGYDWTFEPGQRLWRKNLRDNDGDGVITDQDGVDPNRNYAYKFGYDNEGSSDDVTSETFRGPGPNSEPETKAIDNLFRRVGGFTEFINYHSAAQLLLYGVGWQVNTPTPDDVLGIAMAGDDAHPAVPGYDPDISAELYTTNGEADSYFTQKYGSFGFTPEMSTCATAADSDPNDQWDAADCGSDFEFPDDEKLIQAEFEKNLPFALATAESAEHPEQPESVVGRTARGLPGRLLRRLLRRPADGRGRRPALDQEPRAQLQDQQRQDQDRRRRRVAGRRALRQREQPLLRELPRRGEGDAGRRSREGLVQRLARPPRRRERRVHLHGQVRHRREGAGDRRRGPQRREPDVPEPARRAAAIRAAAPERPAQRGLQRRPLGHRHPGRPERAGRARPLQGGRLVHGRQPHHPGPGRLPHRTRRSGRCPTSRWPSASSTSRSRCATS